VKLLVDMNLSPSWIDGLARHGFDVVHWSTIGAATAPDTEILTWANERAFVLITNDRDSSAILAASGGASPSVVQIRTKDLLSDVVVGIVANALDVHREDIERGALLSIDEVGTRVRVPSASALDSRGIWFRNSKFPRMLWTFGEKPSRYASKSALSCCWVARAFKSRSVNFDVL
jgi:predicted nuclease of predicted toxin-antitoxin system